MIWAAKGLRLARRRKISHYIESADNYATRDSTYSRFDSEWLHSTDVLRTVLQTVLRHLYHD
jgi:hypothetical protein